MRPGSRIPNGQEPSPVPAPPGQQAKDRPGPSDPHHPSSFRDGSTTMPSTTPAPQSRRRARLLPGLARPPADHPPKDGRRTATRDLIHRAAVAAGTAVLLLGPVAAVAGPATGAAAATTVTGAEVFAQTSAATSNRADTVPGANAPQLPAGSHSWKIVRSANRTGTVSYLDAVACSSSTDCEAVGYYRTTSGASLPLAEVWNGTNWALQTIPNPKGSTGSVLLGVACPSATHCEAVGYYTNSSQVQAPLAERWNGTTWALQAIPDPTGSTQSQLQAVACPSSTRCQAVGYYNNSSNGVSTVAERWNGTTWALRTTPNPGTTQSDLQAVACPSTTDCEAVGYQDNSSGVFVTLAEDWNGTTWAVQTTPSPAGAPDSYLYGEACSSATSCEAVGYYVPSSQGGSQMLAERWNGTTWALQTTPIPAGAIGSTLNEVACPSSTPDCEAVGAYSASSSPTVTLAERWNGTTWALQTTPNRTGVLDSELNAVACLSATDCEAVGDDLNSSNVTVTLAERWS